MPGKLWTPGQGVGRPPGGPAILVPSRYADKDVEATMICRVPVGGGEICGKPFFPGEERAWQKHVGECAARHRDEIDEQSPRTRLPAFDPERDDPEIAAHMKKVGKRMLEEGRWVVKPSERAGFS